MPALEPAYLVLGTDLAKVAVVLDRLRAHFPPEAIESQPAASGSARALVDSFMTMGLLAEQRLVIVTAAHEWPADDVSLVLTYLDDPAPDVVLLLVADKLAANSRLRKAFAKPRLIECAGPGTPVELREWAERVFSASGARGDRNAVKRLIELCCGIDLADKRAVKELDGSDLARLRTDVALAEPLASPVTNEALGAVRQVFEELEFQSLVGRVDALIAR
ncbi:MAG: polymerase subunit delta [Thermoleophilia bacterium]|nr:polymerase subunit delta [Thermoleophilia bacterium]